MTFTKKMYYTCRFMVIYIVYIFLNNDFFLNVSQICLFEMVIELIFLSLFDCDIS